MTNDTVGRINQLLAEMGSTFRTEDGVTLVKHLGGLVFLRKIFDSPDECLRFVKAINARFIAKNY